MLKINELDINYFVALAKSHIGEIHDVEFQSMSRCGEIAGKFEIIDFVEDNAHFGYEFWKNEENETPDTAELGYYVVKITETKFYNGKTIRVPVSAYVQDETGITKALYIGNINLDTGKALKAYEFGIIDFRVYA